jgi:nitrile hydratase
MNGIHDVGGMHGFGSVDTSEHEDTFHEEWEGVTYATFAAGLGTGTFGIDEFRHSIERMPPEDYLGSSYYDRWIRGITRLFVEEGVIDPEELTERTAAFAAGEADLPRREDPDLLGELAAGVKDAYDADHGDAEPRFEAGDRVLVRNHNPEGHTRCPRYVRRAEGVVHDTHGAHTLPDAAAHGDERGEPLYSVEFDADELWGDEARDDTAGSRVSVNLWEGYLEPAER